MEVVRSHEMQRTKELLKKKIDICTTTF